MRINGHRPHKKPSDVYKVIAPKQYPYAWNCHLHTIPKLTSPNTRSMRTHTSPTQLHNTPTTPPQQPHRQHNANKYTLIKFNKLIALNYYKNINDGQFTYPTSTQT